jgi:predicted RNA-binding protein
MCESNVYLAKADDETLVMESVGWIEFEDGRIVLRDMIGREQVLDARVKYADLVRHRIVLEPAGAKAE